nr:extracellular solute-binding protein [Anaerolineae bacterium]
ISPDGQAFEGYFDSPEAVNAFQFYADLYNRYQVAPLPVDLTAFGGGNSEFQDGRAAMLFFGRWPQTSLLENPNVELAVVSPPQSERQANLLIWSGFGIARNSPHQEAAWRFLRFYTGQQGAEVWKDWALPAVQPVAEAAGLTADPIDGVWLAELDHVVPRGYTYTAHWESTAEPALRRLLEQIIIDPQTDIPKAVSAAARLAEAQLNDGR